MLAKQYADSLAARLPADLFEPVPSRVLWLPVHGLIAAVCTILIIAAHLNLAARLGLAVVIGFSFSCLGILAHEILHGLIVERLWLRVALGTMCLAPLGVGPRLWMIWHNLHHANTQDPGRDPDNWGTAQSVPADCIMGQLRQFTNPRTWLFPFFLATGVTGHAAALLFGLRKEMTANQRRTTLIEFAAVWLFWVALGFWMGWINLVLFFLIPLLLANVLINSFVITNHFLSPLDDGNDPLASSLTVTTYPWVEGLLLNFNYHAEHHLFPGMSPRYAPLVSELLKESWPDHYHRLPFRKAVWAVWMTPRLYYDRTRLIDTRNGTLYGTLGVGAECGVARIVNDDQAGVQLTRRV